MFHFPIFRLVYKRSNALTPESINKLTRPRFGKRVMEEVPLNKLFQMWPRFGKRARAMPLLQWWPRFGKRDSKEKEVLSIPKRSIEMFEMSRPKFGRPRKVWIQDNLSHVG